MIFTDAEIINRTIYECTRFEQNFEIKLATGRFFIILDKLFDHNLREFLKKKNYDQQLNNISEKLKQMGTPDNVIKELLEMFYDERTKELILKSCDFLLDYFKKLPKNDFNYEYIILEDKWADTCVEIANTIRNLKRNVKM